VDSAEKLPFSENAPLQHATMQQLKKARFRKMALFQQNLMCISNPPVPTLSRFKTGAAPFSYGTKTAMKVPVCHCAGLA
jgi:hypothetical protein